jgi:hypothetical protein
MGEANIASSAIIKEGHSQNRLYQCHSLKSQRAAKDEAKCVATKQSSGFHRGSNGEGTGGTVNQIADQLEC